MQTEKQLSRFLQTVFFKDLYEIIKPVIEHDPAHNFEHSLRVAKNSLEISQIEGGDQEVLVTAAFLHDIILFKKNHPDARKSAELSARKACAILEKLNFDKSKLQTTHDAIMCHSFSAGLTPKTLEGRVFQDADRLDALGAIGISRLFITGASFGSKIYCKNDPFAQEGRALSDKKYMIDHFFVKLFKIPEKMQTQTGKLLAQKRVAYMKTFLTKLQKEIL
jgi:uncharacterized protein